MKSAIGLTLMLGQVTWEKIPEIVKGIFWGIILMALFLGIVYLLTPHGYGVMNG